MEHVMVWVCTYAGLGSGGVCSCIPYVPFVKMIGDDVGYIPDASRTNLQLSTVSKTFLFEKVGFSRQTKGCYVYEVPQTLECLAQTTGSFGSGENSSSCF